MGNENDGKSLKETIMNLPELYKKHDELYEKQGGFEADKKALDYLRENHPTIAGFFDKTRGWHRLAHLG